MDKRMMVNSRRMMIWAAGVFVLLTVAADASSRTERYVGTAVDLKSGKLIYTEEHEAFYTDNVNVRSVITYRDVNKTVIGKKEIEFNGDSPAASFRREDFRTGTVEGASLTGKNVKLTRKEDAKSPLREEVLSIPGTVAIDAGLNNIVRGQWDRLQRNDAVTFNLGVPSQLDYFEFRVVKDRMESVNGRNTMVVRFESDHWYIRLFVDPVVVWYDTETRRAVRYEGISNLYDEKGKSYVVRVTFDRPGP
ncbi:MAG: hypothetical protein HUU02_15230 [Bacteroidetes bacterium]|nr:hypothetical protein [Bacteroidota bacterium]